MIDNFCAKGLIFSFYLKFNYLYKSIHSLIEYKHLM